MKYIISLLICLFGVNAIAATTPPTPPTPIQPRVSIFSTTVDWEAVTGLRLNQYVGKIGGINRDLVRQGLVLYYLDSFPCYGEASNVRVWLSPDGKPDQDLRLVCIYKPDTISFAWRNATAEATEARTTGMLTCPIDGDRYFTIDISKCSVGEDWKDRK